MENEDFNLIDHGAHTKFSQTPVWLYGAGGGVVHLAAIGVWTFIKGRWGGSPKGIYPGRDKLSEELKVNVKTLDKYLAHLEEIGAVRITQRGLQQTNLYELAWDVPLLQEGK